MMKGLQRVIQYYGPATWGEDGFWGYCTPIYILNSIIWLQAVVEIITNDTAKALNRLAKQQTKICNATYLSHLTLDYLLASEGGVCGKFNLTYCCSQIDDEGKVIKKITNKMKKLARVPVQTWKGWSPNDLLGGWFSTLARFRTLIGTAFLVLGACLILPCLMPLVLRSFRIIMEATVERKTAAHVIALWKYKPLDQDDAL
jgi:hypothetical protein